VSLRIEHSQTGLHPMHSEFARIDLGSECRRADLSDLEEVEVEEWDAMGQGNEYYRVCRVRQRSWMDSMRGSGGMKTQVWERLGREV